MDNVTLIRIVAGVLTLFVFLPLIVVPYWKIFSKAGFSGALSLLMLVPLANIVVLYYVAFSDWKIRQTEASQRRYHPTDSLRRSVLAQRVPIPCWVFEGWEGLTCSHVPLSGLSFSPYPTPGPISETRGEKH